MNRREIRRVLTDLASGELDPASVERAVDTVMGEHHKSLDEVAWAVTDLADAVDEFQGAVSHDAVSAARLRKLARRRFSREADAAAGARPDLEEGIRTLSSRIGALVEGAIGDARRRAELELAGDVQRRLQLQLPRVVAGVRVCGWHHGAAACSVEWGAIEAVGSDGLALGLGAVTGQGAAAAFVGALARGVFAMASRSLGQDRAPSQVLAALDGLVLERLRGQFFLSTWVAHIDARHSELRACGAGRLGACLLRDGRDVLSLDPDRGAPLGSERGEEAADLEHPLRPGDVVVAYTDGLVDAGVASGLERFGEARLREACESARVEGPEAMCGAVRAALESHVGPVEGLTGDATLLVAQHAR